MLRFTAVYCEMVRNGAEMAGAGLRFIRELVGIGAEIAGGDAGGERQEDGEEA